MFFFLKHGVYTNLTRILRRYTGCANMNFLYVKAFDSYRVTDKQTRPKLYTTPLRMWSIIRNVSKPVKGIP